MTKARASIFDVDSDDLDVSGFVPKATTDAKAPPREQVRAVSEAAQFRSREPVPARSEQPTISRREPRRFRTGRNQQFNVKASAETIEEFYAISDAQNWVLGETLERALVALRRELAGQGP